MVKLAGVWGGWGLCVGLLASGCAGSDDGEGMGDTQGVDESSTAAPTGSSSVTPGDDGGDDDGVDASEGADVDSSGAGTEPDSSGGGDSSDGGDSDGGDGDSGSEVVWDEEFVWVADFLRLNCVSCHATNANGNLVIPSPDIGYDEVRLALEGVDATTGLKLVEPFDREASQTWLQITNEFGAQFPVEDTDRFGDWIDAGAVYVVE